MTKFHIHPFMAEQMRQSGQKFHIEKPPTARNRVNAPKEVKQITEILRNNFVEVSRKYTDNQTFLNKLFILLKKKVKSSKKTYKESSQDIVEILKNTNPEIIEPMIKILTK